MRSSGTRSTSSQPAGARRSDGVAGQQVVAALPAILVAPWAALAAVVRAHLRFARSTDQVGDGAMDTQ